ncbi:MAG: hypothetical protein HOC77_09130 [Chloroflexi bacterium]|nr:hypothetical protein [Chloroflexota bacterium]MBT4515234.1 hypothetical protein [Chloroflexota bacterium]MBT5319442.1 hypothetical protein [Chloroflexota bacterium]MBT6681890.1 hypothetical protein [Chloroflexota bacterium]
MAVEDQFQNASPFQAEEAASVVESDEVIDGFRLTDGESVVDTLEVDGTDRFILTDMRVIYIGGDEDHRNWSFASLSEVTSVEVTRVSRERSSLYWGVLGLVAALGIWQVATNDTVGIVGGIVMAALGALLLWDYYLRTPPSRLLFHADGQPIGGPLSRSAEVGARSFGDSVFELKSRGDRAESTSGSAKTAGITRRYRYPAP